MAHIYQITAITEVFDTVIYRPELCRITRIRLIEGKRRRKKITLPVEKAPQKQQSWQRRMGGKQIKKKSTG